MKAGWGELLLGRVLRGEGRTGRELSLRGMC